MPRRRSAGPWVLALVSAVVLVAASPAAADVFVVNTTSDTVGAGGCPATCTLRAAVSGATSTPGTDTIQVPAGTYALTSGALAMNAAQNTTLAGAGANSTIISSGGLSRVLALGGEANVTVTGVTLRGGAAAAEQFQTGTGGNVLVGNTATLLLDHVRVTAGTAARGAGIGALSAGIVAVSNSLIDTNTATGTAADGGGGVWIDGQTASDTAFLLADSTVAFNSAPSGGGIAVRNNGVATTMLMRGATVAFNRATATLGGGVSISAPVPPVQTSGTILAGNLGAAGVPNVPSNCDALLTDGGGNVQSGADCGLPSGRQNTDPQLSAALVNDGGQTPVLSIPATSPAVDFAGACASTTDQRDVARPQGAACDAGAYELVPAVAPPPPDPAPDPIPFVPPPPPPPVIPVADTSVVIATASGKVLVRLPRSRNYVDVTTVRSIPLDSIIDATHGKVTLTSAADENGHTQTATFYGGKFRVTQTGKGQLTTVLTLVGDVPLCTPKPTPKPKAKAKAKTKSAASAKAKSSAKTKPRQLWGDGKGRFSTKGQYSSATVRGTKWLVQDLCKTTVTRVARGVVTVRDFFKHKSVNVHSGKSYRAGPKA